MRIQDRKIVQLLQAYNIDIPQMARDTNVKTLKVNKVIRGDAQFTDDDVRRIKRHLGIADMPLTEQERAATEERIYYMRDLIRNRQFDEAKAVSKELSPLLKLEPCDADTPMLYRIFEAQLLLQTDNLDAAEEKLSYIQERINEISDKHRYYYYKNVGTLHYMRGLCETALAFYKKAYKLSKGNSSLLLDESENQKLHVNIATCYLYLQLPNRAMKHLLKIRGVNYVSRVDRWNWHMDMALAQCYVMINDIDEAEELLNSCYAQANGFKNEFYIGLVSLRFGELYVKSENWEAAISHLERAVSCYEKGTALHFTALYRKIRCLLDAGKGGHYGDKDDRPYYEMNAMIEELGSLYGDDEVFSVYVDAIKRYRIISGRIDGVYLLEFKHVETVIAPHFIKHHDYYELVDYYKILERSFLQFKKNYDGLIYPMTKAIRDIYERCMFGDERSKLP